MRRIRQVENNECPPTPPRRCKLQGICIILKDLKDALYAEQPGGLGRLSYDFLGNLKNWLLREPRDPFLSQSQGIGEQPSSDLAPRSLTSPGHSCGSASRVSCGKPNPVPLCARTGRQCICWESVEPPCLIPSLYPSRPAGSVRPVRVIPWGRLGGSEKTMRREP